jgi:hypothetical protein
MPSEHYHILDVEECDAFSRAKIQKKVENSKYAAIITPNPDAVFERLKTEFKYVEAAGGVVMNDSGELLMIHLRGRWDLPKGHVEMGESSREAALREVVLRDREYILEQMKIYQGYGPTVFICCGPGMFDLVASDVCGIDVSVIDHNKKPTACRLDNDSCILAFSHPNSRKGGLDKLFREYISALLEKQYVKELPSFSVKKIKKIEDLYDKAVEAVREHQCASVSFLQRSLDIGFRDATKIIDLLEDRGIIGPIGPNSPRKVFV